MKSFRIHGHEVFLWKAGLNGDVLELEVSSTFISAFGHVPETLVE